MTEMNSVIFLLMLESLAVLVLLVLGYYIFTRKRTSSDQRAANNFIDKFIASEEARSDKLEKLFNNNNALKSEELNALVKEINVNERALYQRIIQIFLNRDAQLLQDVDGYVSEISAVYHRMIESQGNQSVVAELESDSDQQHNNAQLNISRLDKENARLSDQLRLAMLSMDEISAEYTQLFSGTKSELELQNSCKKMLEIYRHAAIQVKRAYKNQKVN